MKKIIIFFVFVFCFLGSFGQSPIGDSLPIKQSVANSANTLLQTNALTVRGGLQFGYFLDTVFANASTTKCKYYPNAFITTLNGTWRRSSDATRWIRIATMNDIINVTGCYALLNGGVVSYSGSGLIMDVSPANYIIGCSFYNSPQSQVTLSTADPSNPRIDVIYVDTNSTVGVITGTAASNPVKPQVDVASQLELTYILVPAGATSIGTTTIVYDENTEWTSGTTATVNFDYTTNPFHLTKSALLSAASGGYITWTAPSPVTITDYNTLKLYVRLNGAEDPLFTVGIYIVTDGGTSASLNLLNYGLNPATSGSYQVITIPLSDFSLTGTEIEQVAMKLNAPTNSMQFDYVQLQGGVPSGDSPYLTNIFVRNDSLFQVRNNTEFFVSEMGGGGSVNVNNGLVKNSSGVVGLDSAGVNPLGRDVLIDGGGHQFGYNGGGGDYVVQDVALFSLASNDDSKILGQSGVSLIHGTAGLNQSILKVTSDSVVIKPYLGELIIDTLNYTLSTTGKKIMLRDTATGLVENIDPALIVPTPTLQEVLTAGSTLDTAATNTIQIKRGKLEVSNGAREVFIIDGNADNNYVFINPDDAYSGVGEYEVEAMFSASENNGNYIYLSAHKQTGNNFVEYDADAKTGIIRITGNKDDAGVRSDIYNYSDSIAIKPHLGVLNIDSLRTWSDISDTTYKKPMTWDTRNGRWEYLDKWPVGGGSSGITIGTTTITSGTNTRVLYNNSGVVGEYTVSGTGNVAMTTSPVFTTPNLGTPSTLVGTNISGTISTRWKARVGSTTSSATPTINTDDYDIYKLTAQAADITSFTTNLTGTPNDGDILEIQITGTATRNITFGSAFVSSTVTIPTATSGTATLTIIFQYYTTSSYGNNKWVCVNYY